MGEVQTWTLNKRKGTTENTYVSDVRNARMLAFDWLGQCLYWVGKANTVCITAFLEVKEPLKSTIKTLRQYLGK